MNVPFTREQIRHIKMKKIVDQQGNVLGTRGYLDNDGDNRQFRRSQIALKDRSRVGWNNRKTTKGRVVQIIPITKVLYDKFGLPLVNFQKNVARGITPLTKKVFHRRPDTV